MKALVSVIIRTCNRPDVLKQALDSVRRQSYENIEIIVVEDGANLSEEIIKKYFSDLDIKYFSTGRKVGRTKAGNYGMGKAAGKYINFLDDDDIFMEDHIETLVNVLEHSQCKAAYSVAEECQIAVRGVNPYRTIEKRKLIRFNQPFNRTLLYHINYFPIQSVMFRRELYEEMGGFDEELDVLEDWDLWVRYSLLTDFVYVDKVTSQYRVIFQRSKKVDRDRKFHDALKDLNRKFEKYDIKVNVSQVNKDMDYIVKRYKTGRLKRYLRLAVDFLVYGER